MDPSSHMTSCQPIMLDVGSDDDNDRDSQAWLSQFVGMSKICLNTHSVKITPYYLRKSSPKF